MTMADKLSIPDALCWSFERNLRNAMEMVSDRDAEVVVASAATALCYNGGQYDTLEKYYALKREIREMLPKVHAKWMRDKQGGKA